jgi:chromosome segregation ATPase
VESLKQKLAKETEKTAATSQEADRLRNQVAALQAELNEAQTVLQELEQKNNTIQELESVIDASKAELAASIEKHQRDLSEQRQITKMALEEVEQVCRLGEQVETAIYAHDLVKEKTLALQELENELVESKIELRTKTEIYQRELASQTSKTKFAMEEAANYKKELGETKQALEESLAPMRSATDASSETIQSLRDSANISKQELSTLHSSLAKKSQRLEDADRELAESKQAQMQQPREAAEAGNSLLNSVLAEITNDDFDKAAAAFEDTEVAGKQEERIDILLAALGNSQDEIEALRRQVESSVIFEPSASAQ